ncbi:MAG: hypothetical protein QM647_12970 [Asticcacaulis sp.]|uniref:hypothetical protein n=1 Tax=Asticcacaulis sp. TaxID=1872648 RepID=UPI0039E3E80F
MARAARSQAIQIRLQTHPVAVPFWLLLSFLISFGAPLQSAVMGAISHDADTIFDATVKHGCACIAPNLASWISTSLYWPYPLIAALITLISIGAKSQGAFALRVTISSAVFLLISDIVSNIFQHSVAFSLSENIIGNVSGGFLLGAISLVCVELINMIMNNSQLRPIKNTFIISLISILIGLSTSATCYYVMAFITIPLPKSVDLVAREPLNFAYITSKNEMADYYIPSTYDDDDPKEQFVLTPRNINFSSISLKSNDKSAVAWSKDAGDVEYDLKIYAAEMCEGDIPNNFKHPIMSVNNINNAAIYLDNKTDKIRFEAANNISALENIKSGTSSTLYSNKSNEKIGITQFINSSDKISLYPHGKFRTIVSLYLFDDEENMVKPSKSTYSIKYNNASTSHTFAFDRSKLPGKPCQEIQVSKISDLDNGTTKVGSPEVSLIADFVPKNTDIMSLLSDEQRVQLNTSAAFIYLDGTIKSELQYAKSGRLSLFQARGNVVRMDVGGQQIPVSPDEIVNIVGHLVAKYNESGALVISSKGAYAWKNQERLNHTKWETLQNEYKLAILTAILTGIGFLTRWLFVSVKPMIGKPLCR